MKSFLVTNLFLSMATVLVAGYGVNKAVEGTVTSFEVKQFENNHEIVNQVNDNKLAKLSELKPKNKIVIDTKEQELPTKPLLKIEGNEIIKKRNIELTKITKPKSIKEVKILNKVKPLRVNNGSLELSYNEINEQGEYSVKKLKKVSWGKIAIDINDYSNIQKLKVAKKINNKISKLAEYSAEKSKHEELPKVRKMEESLKKESDELVFFDYNESQEPVLESQAIDNHKVVKQEVIKKNESPKLTGISGIAKTGPTITKDSLLDFNNIGKLVGANKATEKVAMAQKLNFKNDNIKTMMSGNEKEVSVAKLFEQNEYACLDEKNTKEAITHKSIYNIELSSIENTKNKFKKIYNFDIRFQDDVDEIVQDYGEGKVKLSYNLSSQMNIRRGVIYTKSHYPTSLDFVFEPGEMDARIPLIHKDTFNKITKEYRAIGGHVLVELDETTEDIELGNDTKYEVKLFLDNNMRIVDRNLSDYNYVMFIGVEAGNSIIHFKKSNNIITNKIIHIASNEIYYEPNFYAEIKTDSFKLFEENLLSKCKSMLNIEQEELVTWSYEAKTNKESLNKHSVGKIVYPLGTRKYYELAHLNESIFIGRWNTENLIVPSEKYINHVMSYFDLGNSESQCVVQLNVNKSAKAIYYAGSSAKGAMPIQMNILDSDGQFYSDFSENSQRVFLLGEQQGVINIKLDYVDGSTQYLQSYCSDSTYLIEQL